MTGGNHFKSGNILTGNELVEMTYDYRPVEDEKAKETRATYFVNGVETTYLIGRWSWKKWGRQGAYQKAQSCIISYGNGTWKKPCTF